VLTTRCEEKENLIRTRWFRSIDQVFPAVPRDAFAAPSFCPGKHGKSLIGGDGISKALMWKMCVRTSARFGNFAGAETFPVRLADAGHQAGLFPFMTMTGDG
jgi:hypothetical protein